MSNCCCNFCFPGSSRTAQGPAWCLASTENLKLSAAQARTTLRRLRTRRWLKPKAEETTIGLLSLIPTHLASRHIRTDAVTPSCSTQGQAMPPHRFGRAATSLPCRKDTSVPLKILCCLRLSILQLTQRTPAAALFWDPR